MAGGREFNRGKFKELVLYLSQESAEDEGFGMVKLNKLLYRADFEAYRLLGGSITGETYQKQEWGPVAHDLLPVLDELEHAGRIVVFSFPAGPYTRKVPTPRPDPDAQADRTAFSEQELEIIDNTLRELASHGAKSVSDWSHETSVGWRAKGIGQEIPYSSALLSIRPLDSRAQRSLEARFA